MFFLHLYCKKEKFPSFTIWLLLSSFGVLLKNGLSAYAHLMVQPRVNNVITTHTFGLENKYDQVNITTATNKEFSTLDTNYVLPFKTFQKILGTSLIATIAICTGLRNFHTQCFAKKRAPPLFLNYETIILFYSRVSF
nr:hypothetical protein [Bartonella senegalensis]